MRLLLFFTLTLIFLNTFAQNKKIQKPLVLKLKIENCSDSYLELLLPNKENNDTLWLHGDGYYHLTTYRVKKPLETIIVSKNIQIKNLLVAPGYNLTITGDGNDFHTLNKTKRFEGIGAESNRYYIILDSITGVRNSSGNLNTVEGRLAQINYNIALRDSIAKAVFKKENSGNGAQAFFYNKVRLDNIFIKVGGILTFLRTLGLGFREVKDILKLNIDAAVLQHISNDIYLISDQYKELIAGDYLTFLIEMDYLKDTSLKNKKSYRLEKIESTYTGRVKEYATKEAIERRFFWSGSVGELNKYRHLFQPYIDGLSNHQYKDKLEKLYANKLSELIETQIGKPAPLFALKNTEGKKYTNEDFKGKVIYLDFWASWCLPCRKQTPHLQKLYDKYLGDNRIIIVSIAVHDREKDWRKAIEQDKPSWLQLFDEKDEAQKQYAAYEIPKFVLINKKGKIVSFDAPPPSDEKKLLLLLELELSK